jgi:hypothetical protein
MVASNPANRQKEPGLRGGMERDLQDDFLKKLVRIGAKLVASLDRISRILVGQTAAFRHFSLVYVLKPY